MTIGTLWHRPISILLTIFISNVFIQSPSNAWDGGTWGLEEVGNNTRNWVINSQTFSTITFGCRKEEKNTILIAKLPLNKTVKKMYGIKSNKKSAWVVVSQGTWVGQTFTFPNGRKWQQCSGDQSLSTFQWFPPAGLENVEVRTNNALNARAKKIGTIVNPDDLKYLFNPPFKYGVVIHPQMKNAIQQASQQVAQGSSNSAPQSNSGSAPQTRSSSTPFVNPYNISGVGRVLQDGSIEEGVYYGGNRQLANDLSSGDFYAAAQNTARSASEAQQMCIASNLSSGNIAAAVYC